MPATPEHPVRQRIAALLPLPLFLRRRWLGEGTDASAVNSSASLGGFAQWSGQLGTAVDPGWLKAAMTAATVAIAGAGAGLAGNAATPTSPVGSLGQLVAGLTAADPDADADDQRRAATGVAAPGAASTDADSEVAAQGFGAAVPGFAGARSEHDCRRRPRRLRRRRLGARGHGRRPGRLRLARPGRREPAAGRAGLLAGPGRRRIGQRHRRPGLRRRPVGPLAPAEQRRRAPPAKPTVTPPVNTSASAPTPPSAPDPSVAANGTAAGDASSGAASDAAAGDATGAIKGAAGLGG